MNSDQQTLSQQAAQQFAQQLIQPQMSQDLSHKQPVGLTAAQDEVAQVAQLGYN